MTWHTLRARKGKTGGGMAQVTTAGLTAGAHASGGARPARRRPRPPEILAAALDVLAETGYERHGPSIWWRPGPRPARPLSTRRWQSKADLVIDAVALQCAAEDLELDRFAGHRHACVGDLVADDQAARDPGRRAQAADHGRGDVDALRATRGCRRRSTPTIVETPRPGVQALDAAGGPSGARSRRSATSRRCRSSPPSMAAYRVLVLKKPVDREFPDLDDLTRVACCCRPSACRPADHPAWMDDQPAAS